MLNCFVVLFMFFMVRLYLLMVMNFLGNMYFISV